MSQMKPENPEDRRKVAEAEAKLDADVRAGKEKYNALLADLTKSVEAGIAVLTAPGTRVEKEHLENIRRVIRHERTVETISFGDDL
jgi:hypothetical protein